MFCFVCFLLLGVRSCTVAACASQLLRAYLLAYFAYHAFAWYVVHAVGRGHGGENIDAAVDVFSPFAMLSRASLVLFSVVCVSRAAHRFLFGLGVAQYEKMTAHAPACLPGAVSLPGLFLSSLRGWFP